MKRRGGRGVGGGRGGGEVRMEELSPGKNTGVTESDQRISRAFQDTFILRHLPA